MLGRPEVDPHGDPIPDVDGAIRQRDLQTLLDCPLDTPVTITRVTDQGAPFLRFIEDSHLKPGETIQVEARDAVADSVRVRGRDEQRMTIGTRAASKLLVEVLSLVLWALAVTVAGTLEVEGEQVRSDELVRAGASGCVRCERVHTSHSCTLAPSHPRSSRSSPVRQTLAVRSAVTAPK